MPVVFVIATDWKLRTAVRAELRELGIDALGMDSPDDAGHTLASNQMPAAIVLEATAELVGNPAIQNLVKRVPTILIASRTETVMLPNNVDVLYRPVRIGDIVAKVRELLACGHAA
jgi:DNA-binding response OmpR family regulator